MRSHVAAVDAETITLYKLLKWGLAVEVPLVIMMVTSAVVTGSAALVAMAAQSLVPEIVR